MSRFRFIAIVISLLLVVSLTTAQGGKPASAVRHKSAVKRGTSPSLRKKNKPQTGLIPIVMSQSYSASTNTLTVTLTSAYSTPIYPTVAGYINTGPTMSRGGDGTMQLTASKPDFSAQKVTIPANGSATATFMIDKGNLGNPYAFDVFESDTGQTYYSIIKFNLTDLSTPHARKNTSAKNKKIHL